MRTGEEVAHEALALHREFKSGWMTRGEFDTAIEPLRLEIDQVKAVIEAERIVKWGL
jgi:hypothetical protein